LLLGGNEGRKQKAENHGHLMDLQGMLPLATEYPSAAICALLFGAVGQIR